jgi:ACT domain-containing protein
MSEFSVIVTASFIPSHPSTKIIDETLNSLKFISADQNFPIILAHDFSDKKQYIKYLETIKYYNEKDKRINIYIRSSHGHLVGNIRNIIDKINTKYILVIQQDLPFIKKFEINKIIEDMESCNELKHIRFNHRKNLKIRWDSISNLFGKQLICNNYTYTKTPAWSDMNHLSQTIYYKNIILNECADGNFMENTLLKRPSNKIGHEKYGTYIFGAYGEENVIKHIDGRHTK